MRSVSGARVAVGIRVGTGVKVPVGDTRTGEVDVFTKEMGAGGVMADWHATNIIKRRKVRYFETLVVFMAANLRPNPRSYSYIIEPPMFMIKL